MPRPSSASAGERASEHTVTWWPAGLQVADHVEGPDLAAALGRVREAMAEIEDVHAASAMADAGRWGRRPSARSQVVGQ
jgi:hypothetical protein